VKYFDWDIEKNEMLQKDRDISFEEVVFYIEQGQLLDVLEQNPRRRNSQSQN